MLGRMKSVTEVLDEVRYAIALPSRMNRATYSIVRTVVVMEDTYKVTWVFSEDSVVWVLSTTLVVDGSRVSFLSGALTDL